MCKIHHAGFDNQLMTVRPDYTIEVQRRVQEEEDGPTLRYACRDCTGAASNCLGNERHGPSAICSKSGTSPSARRAEPTDGYRLVRLDWLRCLRRAFR